MINIIIDTLIDTLKLLPFLFIAFFIIEAIEHKVLFKSEKIIKKSGKLGPLFGSLLGAIPQCGFGVIATNFYITRIVSLGTLISIYLSTSDEMLPILISHHTNISIIIKIILIKIIIGLIFGYIIDLIFIRKKNKEDIHKLCEHDHCECEENIFKSSIIHTLKIALFILIFNFFINIIFEYLGEKFLSNLLLKDTLFSPLIASLIGLIPNCGSSILLTELFLNDSITLSTCISGLLTSAGISLAILFKSNNNIKENISIVVLLYLIGVTSGIIINLIGALI